MQTILAVVRCLLKSYKQKKFYEFHIIFGHHVHAPAGMVSRYVCVGGRRHTHTREART